MKDFNEYDATRLIIEDLVTERLAVAELSAAVSQLANVLDRNRWIWDLGDGHGGFVKQRIDAQIESLGFSWSPPTDTSVDPARQAILDRDGHMCVNCFSEDELQIDHIHPRSRGGGNDPDNLQVLCGPCNRSKHALTMDEWEESGKAADRRAAS
jgi:hypothetical protein